MVAVRSNALRELDWLMIAVVVLSCLGLVMAVSVGTGRGDAPLRALEGQGAKLLAGTIAFLVAASVPLDWLRRGAVTMLLAGILLCLLALLFPDSHGAHRWIRFGTVGFQPVDFARFALVIYCAAWIGYAGEDVAYFRTGFVPLMVPAMLLAVCLLLQPDFGNALISVALAATMALVGGVRWRYFAVAGLPALAGIALVVRERGYVQDRLTGYLDVEPGSQVWQSLVAISSGGVTGRGLGEGWMKMGFVPEADNDFVFAVIGEELGLLGSLLVVGLYATIGIVVLRLVLRMREPFHRMLVFGFGFAICTQAAINLLVVTGMAPAKGIDLPLLSSGGTNLVYVLAAVGIIGNAARSDPTSVQG